MCRKTSAVNYAAVLLPLIVWSSVVASEPEQPPTLSDELQLAPPVIGLVDLVPTEFIDCRTCLQTCPNGQHRLAGDLGGPDRAYGEIFHNCEPGFCSAAHPSVNCDEQMALSSSERIDLWHLAVGGDVDQLPVYVASFGGRVTYNETRQSLQTTGCDGSIVLNIPLTSTQARVFQMQ